MALWLGSLVFAQDAVPLAEAVPVLEITVWGRLAVDQAEDAVVREMESLGYRAVRKGDRIIFRPPRAWMGAGVWRDGMLTFRRPVAGFQAAPTYIYEKDLARESGAVDPSGRATNLDQGGVGLWVLPSPKKRRAQRARVRGAVADELAWYSAVVARTALEDLIASLPDRLDAVWEHGTPLSGAAPLDTRDARRKHVLAYWATRSDTPEGQRVCRAVAGWLRAVVEQSDAPITAEERTEFEGQRTDVLTLP